MAKDINEIECAAPADYTCYDTKCLHCHYAEVREKQKYVPSGLLAGYNADSSSVEKQLDAANELINALYDSGCLDTEREMLVQKYLGVGCSSNY